jgi:hypothetical protein
MEKMKEVVETRMDDILKIYPKWILQWWNYFFESTVDAYFYYIPFHSQLTIHHNTILDGWWLEWKLFFVDFKSDS